MKKVKLIKGNYSRGHESYIVGDVFDVSDNVFRSLVNMIEEVTIENNKVELGSAMCMSDFIVENNNESIIEIDEDMDVKESAETNVLSKDTCSSEVDCEIHDKEENKEYPKESEIQKEVVKPKRKYTRKNKKL